MSLEKFLATIGDSSIAEQSRYLVEITPPAKLNGSMRRNSEKEASTNEILSLYCTGSILPESTFNIAQRYTYGMPKPVVSTKVNPTALTLDFYVDRDMKVKRFWDSWHELIYPLQTRSKEKFMLSYPDDYTSTISISQLDRSGYIVYKVRLYNAFPKMISDMKLDSAASTNPATIQVTIDYQFWNEVWVTDQPEVAEKKDRGVMGEIGDKISGVIGSIDQTVASARSGLKKFTTFSF